MAEQPVRNTNGLYFLHLQARWSRTKAPFRNLGSGESLGRHTYNIRTRLASHARPFFLPITMSLNERLYYYPPYHHTWLVCCLVDHYKVRSP
ncbi:hypothetical protein B0I35DRAFT_428784 [Stachybotrys elegans]|uniref:Uncharacterized protein n=1 Tax=Stachybotrys elegans TaxID=80388 RepID=A0A8K0SY07_9HYPO|nr:hypothetical protein B0I35DRAFT_428784 [Stachybotrys elegans]